MSGKNSSDCYDQPLPICAYIGFCTFNVRKHNCMWLKKSSSGCYVFSVFWLWTRINDRDIYTDSQKAGMLAIPYLDNNDKCFLVHMRSGNHLPLSHAI